MTTIDSPSNDVGRAPRGTKILAPAKLKQATSEEAWKRLRKEVFRSIRNFNLRSAGAEVLFIMDASDDKTITADQIVKVFEKHSIALFGGRSFHTELARISNVIHNNHSCRIKKLGDNKASTDPERKFAVFHNRKTPTKS